jgi:prepilin peptidase CpaA
VTGIALLAVFPALMAYAAVSDLFTMTIPNKLSLAVAVAFAVFALASGMTSAALVSHLGAGALVLAASFALFSFGWIGGGDAKLAAAVALWFGFSILIDYLVLAAMAGGVLTLALLLLRGFPLPRFALQWPWALRLHDRKTGIPYGIALAGAALVIYPRSPLWLAMISG